MKTFYIKTGEQFKGPYTLRQLREMWKKGSVTSKTTFCEEGGTQWRSLGMMESVLVEGSSDSPKHPPEPEEHCSVRLIIYCALGLAGFAAIILVLRSLAK